MSDTYYVRVRNWGKFQQYKDGRPLRWIKLYTSVLGNYEIEDLPEATQLHLIKIWLLAANQDNKLPADPDWIGRKIEAKSPVDLTRLLKDEFLEPVGDVSVEEICKSLESDNVQNRTDSYITPGTLRTQRALARGEKSREEKSTEGSSLRSSPSGEAGSDVTPIEDMDSDQLLKAGNGAIAARYLPLTRETCWDGESRPAVEGRCVNMYRQMLEKDYGADRIEYALKGFRDLVDKNEVVWLDPGDDYPPWAMYNQKIGSKSAVMVAAERGREIEGSGVSPEVESMMEGIG